MEREIGAGAGSVLLEGLEEEKTYTLTFSPTGPRVPQDIGQVSPRPAYSYSLDNDAEL